MSNDTTHEPDTAAAAITAATADDINTAFALAAQEGGQEADAAPWLRRMELATAAARRDPDCRPSIPPVPPPPPPCLVVHPPSYFTQFQLAEDAILVGDCHFVRGEITLLAGVPGCGKSRLLMSLAIAGKQGHGSTWMDMPVHAGFRTLILQAENGEVRLKRELQDILGQGHELDAHLLLSPPPPQGLNFGDPAFCHAVRELILQERPGILAIDPWNRVVLDDKARDFRAALNDVQNCIPDIPDKPAIVILHHLRKGMSGEGRKQGRDLLNEISGSYLISAASRCAFILEPATPDPEDNRVVLTCAKNNNGEMGKPTAWHRQNGLFAPCEDFDWEEWRAGPGGGKKRHTVELEDLAELFGNGRRKLTRLEAARLLAESFSLSKSTSYDILRPTGRFSANLSEVDGILHFRP